MDADGNVVVPPRFRSVLSTYFSEGLCPFEEDSRCGYFDTVGEIVIPPIYTSATDFCGDRAAVCSGESWGYIDRSGSEVIPFAFDDACSFAADGLATVQHNGKWGHIDRSGKFIIEPRFDEAYDFDGELAKVELGEKFGYVNRDDEIVWLQD